MDTMGDTLDSSGTQWRVDFDAEVEFSNGGGLAARGFRLDIVGDSISNQELGELFVRHLGLLMVGSTTITRKELIREPHKGGRAVATEAGPRRVVELTGPDGVPLHGGGQHGLAGQVDLPTVLVRTLGGDPTAVDRGTLVPFDLAGRAVLVHSGAAAGLTVAAAQLLVENGAALVGVDAADAGAGAAVLAGADIPVVTDLRGLDQVPASGMRLHAVPCTAAGPRARVYGVVG